MAAIDPGRVVADLRDLKGLTGDDGGAQRVAWTDTWTQACTRWHEMNGNIKTVITAMKNSSCLNMITWHLTV